MKHYPVTRHLRAIALLLSAAIAFNHVGFAYQTLQAAQAQRQAEAHTAKVKAQVEDRGAGEKSRVKVKLSNNGGGVKGYISRIDATSFQVTDQKSGRITTINYAGRR